LNHASKRAARRRASQQRHHETSSRIATRTIVYSAPEIRRIDIGRDVAAGIFVLLIATQFGVSSFPLKPELARAIAELTDHENTLSDPTAEPLAASA
jgi:hypothetical protein